MDRQEQILNLAKIARISVAYAEDLYDSFFPKPIVPQYVADWYEGNKDDLETALYQEARYYEEGYEEGGWTVFQDWLVKKENKALRTLVNMHQFGYTVESESRYTVRLKGLTSKRSYLNYLIDDDRWYLNDEVNSVAARTHHTRKELEEGGFGEVFDNPMFEVEEVMDEQSNK